MYLIVFLFAVMAPLPRGKQSFFFFLLLVIDALTAGGIISRIRLDGLSVSSSASLVSDSLITLGASGQT